MRPTGSTSWPAAQRIHGISPAEVTAAPALSELLPELNRQFAGARVECAMLRDAAFKGEWNPYYGNYRWH